MKSSKELLTALLKSTQMSQIGIRSVLDTTMGPDLRNALHTQLREFDSIETEAQAIACRRGWELNAVDPAVRFMTDRMTRFRVTGRDSDSRIADMIIQGNTRGMIQGFKNLHSFTEQDQTLRILCQKLLDCQSAGIQKMQGFL